MPPYNLGESLVKQCAEWRAPSFFVYGDRENGGAGELLKKLQASFNVVILDVRELVHRCPKSEVVSDLLGGGSLTDEGIISLLIETLEQDDIKFRGYALHNIPITPKLTERMVAKGLVPEFSIIFDILDDDERQRRAQSIRVDFDTKLPFSVRLVEKDIANARLRGKDALEALIRDAKDNGEELDDDEMMLENTTDMEFIETRLERIEKSLDAVSTSVCDPKLGQEIGKALGSTEVWSIDTSESVSHACDSILLKLWEAGVLPSASPRRLPTPSDVDEANCYETLRTQGCERTGARRWSPWLQFCPVTLANQGRVVKGRVDFAVEFLGNVFLLANEDALHGFIRSPQKYLVAMPDTLVKPSDLRVVVLGPPWSGLTTQCAILADTFDLVHLDIRVIMKDFLALPIPALSDEVKEWLQKKEEEKNAALAARGRSPSRGMYRSRSRSPSVSRSGSRSSIGRSRSASSTGEDDEDTPTTDDMSREIIESYKLRKALVKAHEALKKGLLLPLESYSFAVFRKIQEVQEDDVKNGRPHRWVLDGYPLVEEQVLDLADKYQVEKYIILTGDGESLLPRLEKMSMDAETGTLLTSDMDSIESPLQLKFPMASLYSTYTTEMADIEQTLAEINVPVSRAPFAGDVNNITSVILRSVDPLRENAIRGELIEPQLEESEVAESIEGSEYGDGEDDDGEDGEAVSDAKKSVYSVMIDGEESLPSNIGETSMWCPVTLEQKSILVKGNERYAASYGGSVYRMASAEALKTFLLNPKRYTRVNADADEAPFVPPPCRIWVVGAQGTQCSEHAAALAAASGMSLVSLESVGRDAENDTTVWTQFDAFDITTPADNGNHNDHDSSIAARGKSGMDADTDTDLSDSEMEDEDKDSVSAFGSRVLPVSGKVLAKAMKSRLECSNGCIIDGSVLSKRQAIALLKNDVVPDIVISLSADSDVALGRLNLEPSESAKLRAIAEADAVEKEEKEEREREGYGDSDMDDDDDYSNPTDSSARAAENIDSLRDTIQTAAERRFDDEVAVLAQTTLILNASVADGGYNIPVVEIDTNPRKAKVQNAIIRACKPLTEWRSSLFARAHASAITPGRAVEALKRGFLSLSPFKRYCPVTWRETGELIALPDTAVESSSYDDDRSDAGDSDTDSVSVDGDGEGMGAGDDRSDDLNAIGDGDNMLGHTLTPAQISLAMKASGAISSELALELKRGKHSFPVVYRNHVYYCASSEAATRFCARPPYYALSLQPPPLRRSPRIAVVGVAAAGKTVLAERLADLMGAVVVSPTDALSMVSGESVMAEIETAARSEDGKGVGADLVTTAYKALDVSPTAFVRGVVMDGWPETKEQAEAINLDAVVVLHVDKEEAVLRLKQDHDNLIDMGLFYSESIDEFKARHDATTKHVSELVSFLKQRRTPVLEVSAAESTWLIGSKALKFVQRVLSQMEARQMSRVADVAVAVDAIGITPSELEEQHSHYGKYCAVSYVDRRYLIECVDENGHLRKGTKLAEYKGKLYHFASDVELSAFISNPGVYAEATFTDSEALPAVVDQTGSEIWSLEGYCVVSFVQRGGGAGKDLSAFVKGDKGIAAEYLGKYYCFASEEARKAFMLEPWTYVDNAILPVRRPPPSLAKEEEESKAAVSLGSLPLEGYLDQAVIDVINEALVEVGSKRPKYPLLSSAESAGLYLALWLRVHNEKGSEFDKKQHSEKLAEFIEKCDLMKRVASLLNEGREPQTLVDEFAKLSL